mgnify:CR=1 FL=1
MVLEVYFNEVELIFSQLMDEYPDILNSVKATAEKHGEIKSVTVFENRLRIQACIEQLDSNQIRLVIGTLNTLISEASQKARNPNVGKPKEFLRGPNATKRAALNNRWLQAAEVPSYDPRKNEIYADVLGKGRDSLEWLIYLGNKIISILGAELRFRILIYTEFQKEYCPFHVQEIGTQIVQTMQQIDRKLDEKLGEIVSSEIVFIGSNPRSNSLSRPKDYLSTLWKTKVSPIEDLLLNINDLVSLDVNASRFLVSAITVGKTMKEVDFLVMTILSEEYTAVSESLIGSRDISESELTYTNICKQGTLPDKNGNERTVLLCKSPEAGNPEMAVTLNQILTDFKAKVAFFLGIAGGIDADLNIGDVVIADEVFYYEKHKETDERIANRSTSYRQSRWTKTQIARLETTIGNGKSKFEMHSTNGNTFSVEKGPIGSGEVVLASTNSEIVAQLKYQHSKTKSVEMEAAGLSMYLEGEQASKDPKIKHTVIIRGISDHADPNKTDKDQGLAAQNAMSVLKEFVANADFSGID